MATHSSILAWKIPWTEEPGGVQSMVFQRIRHDLATTQQQLLTLTHHPYSQGHQSGSGGIWATALTVFTPGQFLAN